MRYSEIAAPAGLDHAVKLAWTLELDGDPDALVPHVAAPDGCMEVIRRLRGRSSWGTPQPEFLVAGVIGQPAELQLSGDACFVGLRLWPWAWDHIAKRPSRDLVDAWAELAEAAPGLQIPGDADAALAMVAPVVASLPPDPLYDAIRQSRSVAEVTRRSGRSHRWLQRWFARHVGIPPRTYLRLLRFSDTLEHLPDARGSLADHAAEHGFADQAHMSREFRAMAGSSAAMARKAAVGPFVPGPAD